eukprot:gene958-1083_t
MDDTATYSGLYWPPLPRNLREEVSNEDPDKSASKIRRQQMAGPSRPERLYLPQ